jgi:hypothetical protein
VIGAAVRRIWRAKKIKQDNETYLVINQLNQAANHEKRFKSPFESDSYISVLNRLEEDLSKEPNHETD